MNIDTIVTFTLDAHVTTVVVNSVNSIVNGVDAIIKTAMENVYIALIVTDMMTGTVTIDTMIVTATATVIVTATATVNVTIHGIAVAVSRAVHLVTRQLSVVTAASRHAAEAAVMNDHLMVTHAMDMIAVTRQDDINLTITTAIARALTVNVLANTVILVRNGQVHLRQLVPARWHLMPHAHRDPAPCPRRAITPSPLEAHARRHRSVQSSRRQPQVPISDRAHHTRADHQLLRHSTTRRSLTDVVQSLIVTPRFRSPMLILTKMARPEFQLYVSLAAAQLMRKPTKWQGCMSAIVFFGVVNSTQWLQSTAPCLPTHIRFRTTQRGPR
jgi:hypothetical protein